MARYLIDANVLLRLVQPTDPLRPAALRALIALRRRGDDLVVVPQTLFEFWNVCTRPAAARGGFGLSISETDALVRRILRRFQLMNDVSAIFTEWRTVVVAHSVAGVQVHDARLAAAMRVHAIDQILTFNVGDFRRYGWVTVVEPATV